tara:strand:+ start:1588 stop:1923 length:336 start_codon:yes stop_codon:yes gene_type:complete
MNLDFEQTYLQISDNVMKMTMKPSVEFLKTKQAFIQTNVPVHHFDQLCFKAEVDIVRQWVLDSGFSLETHAYDFGSKKIIEVPNSNALSSYDASDIRKPVKGLLKTNSEDL